MRLIQKIYDTLMCWTIPLQSVLLFVVRLIWGWQFMWAGWGKLNNLEGTKEFFDSLGIASPDVMAVTVGSIEAVCGLLILLGLVSRLAALPLVCVMIGAYVTAHTQAALAVVTDFEVFTKQAPFLFLYASLLVLCFGPGKISLDYLLRTKD